VPSIPAALSDALGVIDHYASPITVPLTDLISVGDHLTASSSVGAVAGAAGLAIFGGLLVIRRERKRKR